MPAWCLNALRNKATAAWLAACLILLVSGSSALANPLGTNPGGGLFGDSTAPRFLPVDEAFAWYVTLDAENRISVHWTIAPGYYLYREQFDFQLLDGNSVALEVNLPAAAPHNDAFFGDVDVYYERVQAELLLPDGIGRQFTLQIRYQGCAEAGLCYPPERREVEIDR